MTASVCSALNRFLFPTEELANKGICVHQCPVGPGKEVPCCEDLYVCKLENGTIPGEVVLIGDGTTHSADFFPSQNQSISYSIISIENSNDHSVHYVQLALPFCTSKCRQDVHVELYDGIWVIPIAETELQSKALLCVLYAGIHYLLDNQVTSTNPPLKSLPFKCWSNEYYTVHGARSYEDDLVNSGRVFLNGSIIYKLFDTDNTHLNVNKDLIDKIGLNEEPYLPGFTVQDVLYSENSQYTPRFKLVKYINGTQKPKTIAHFTPILKTLQKIHDISMVHGDISMVHGDIRQCNLVFGEGESDIYIIDFDMASQEGTPCSIHVVRYYCRIIITVNHYRVQAQS